MTAYNQAQWQDTHTNGRIPRRDLAEIVPPDFDEDLNGPALMHPEAAWNYQRMRDAAKAEDIALVISFSYRTFEKQEEKKKIDLAGGNTAATPGTSNHGWGTALDLNLPKFEEFTAESQRRFDWLKANGPRRFGFHQNDARKEPWHWDYEGGFPIEEDEMTPEEKAEFDAMKKTIKEHERLIDALRVGLGTEEDPATFVFAGKRVARSVRKSEGGREEGDDSDDGA